MQPHSFKFDDFELNLTRYDLRCKGRVIKLEKLPMELLILLISRKGTLVSREEMIEKLWGADVFVDSEHGINTAIRKIRQALKDDPERARFVETVVGKGYRFVAPVTATEDTDAESPRLQAGETADSVRLSPRLSAPLFWIVPVAAVALLGLLLGFNLGGLRDRAMGKASPGRIQSVAILPLENLSGDPSQEYFTDGLTEEIITSLARLGSLRVISRGSAMQYKGTKKTLPEIARELNVEAVVEGSLSRSGDRVRVRVQLIDAATDLHLWAETFDGELRDVLVLQSDVAGAIVRRVQASLTLEGQRKRPRPAPVVPAALEAYLKGRFAWNRRNEAALQEGIDYFREAIVVDPGYASAYSGMADSYTAMGYFSYLSPQESFAPARAAALKALQLDTALAEPHASLAYVRFYYDWDWAGAEKEFKEAIALDPNYATAHHWYSVYLTALGRRKEALEEIRRAQQLDPLSAAIDTDIGFQLYYARQFDEAIRRLHATLRTNPKLPLAHLWLGRAYQEQRMYDQALAEFQQAESVMRDWPVTIAARGYVLGTAGRKAEAKKVLAELIDLSKKRYVTAYGVALLHAGLGDKEEALAWLNRAVDERTHWLVWLKLDPRWDRLRSDPRFQDLQRRVGFPE